MPGKTKRVHFIGIGGIGMSGIAEVLINLGFDVSGSDVEESPITDRLKSLGAVIYPGHSSSNVEGSDIVVVSSAIKAGNKEVSTAREMGLPVIPRSDMLGELMRMRTGIAVAGMHGKTTTTSLAATVLEKAGLDPTVIVGGRIKSLKSNARLGEGEFLIAEADESDGNFVRLSPVFAVITNIDVEHLDFYGGLENIYDAFVDFARRVPFHGLVVCCLDDPHVRAIMPKIDRRIVTYGLESGAVVMGRIKEQKPDGTSFSVMVHGRVRGDIFLRVPGRYNVLNALAVCSLADELGIEFSCLQEAFSEFQGVGRRFEIKGEVGGVLFVDDYAHHPTEIARVIEAARDSYDRRIIAVFQPHRFTRTRDLHESFANCFRGADAVFITDIYAAGERPIPGVSADLIYRAVLKGGSRVVDYLPVWTDLKKSVKESIVPGDMVITLGAGNIWRLGVEILEEKGWIEE